VKRALEGLSGVKKAEVSFSKEQATIYFDERKTNVKQMIEAVGKAGFRGIEKPAQ
jgi:copper chaperone CopZ